MRVWLADLLMVGGGCAVVAGSPFGLAWYIAPPLIVAGIGVAALGLAAAPSWWRAGAFAGIALSWMPAGLVILIGLGAGRFVWPGRLVSDRRLVVADYLVLLAGGCLVIGVWYGGWVVPLTISAAAAVASHLLERHNRWRVAMVAAVLVVMAASLCGGDAGGTAESVLSERSGVSDWSASPPPGVGPAVVGPTKLGSRPGAPARAPLRADGTDVVAERGDVLRGEAPHRIAELGLGLPQQRRRG